MSEPTAGTRFDQHDVNRLDASGAGVRCAISGGSPFSRLPTIHKLARFVIGRFATHSSAGIYATKLFRNISLPFSRYHKRMACFGPRESSAFRAFAQ
jgi:hypothetical protein